MMNDRGAQVTKVFAVAFSRSASAARKPALGIREKAFAYSLDSGLVNLHPCGNLADIRQTMNQSA